MSLAAVWQLTYSALYNSYSFITMVSGLAIGIRISLGGARPWPISARSSQIGELTTQRNIQARHYVIVISGVSGVGHLQSSRPIWNHWIYLTIQNNKTSPLSHHGNPQTDRIPELYRCRGRLAQLDRIHQCLTQLTRGIITLTLQWNNKETTWRRHSKESLSPPLLRVTLGY